MLCPPTFVCTANVSSIKYDLEVQLIYQFIFFSLVLDSFSHERLLCILIYIFTDAVYPVIFLFLTLCVSVFCVGVHLFAALCCLKVLRINAHIS